MKKFSRLLSIFIAFVVVLGSLSFSRVAFGEEEVLSEVVIEEEVINEGENEEVVVEEEIQGIIVEEIPVILELEDEFLNINTKPPKEPTGNLKLHKRIERSPGHVDANIGDGEFTVTLTGPLGQDSIVRTVVIDKDDNTGDHGDFDDLPYGTYIIDEVNIYDPDNEYDGWRLQRPGNHGDEVDPEIEINKKNATFNLWLVNKIADDTPPPSDDTGSLIVHKRIKRWVDRENDKIDSNLGDDEFTITLSGPLPEDGDLYDVRTLVINQNGNTGDHVTFNDLPYGTYTLEETYINDDPVNTNDYYIVLPGNHGEAVGDDVLINSNGTEQRWIINEEGPPHPPWEGTIRIQKSIRGEEDPSLQGFEFELWTNGEKIRGPEETDAFGELEFNELSAGIYEIKEVNSEYIAEYLDDNPVTIGPDQDMENDDVWVVRVNNRMIEKEDIVVQKIVSNDDDLSGFTFRLYRVIEGEEEFVAVDTTGPTGIVTFENQPDGDYVIYEDIRVGYEMGIGAVGSDDGEEFTHSENMQYPIDVRNVKIITPPPILGRITVEKVVQTRFGNLLPSNNTRFYFELDMRIEGIWVEILDKFIDGNGTIVFDDLEDGEYRVREVNIDDDFDLFSDNNIIVVVEDGSTEEVEFINRALPPPDDDDEPDDDDDDDDDPEDEPEEEEEEEDDEDVLDEVVVIEEPTPEAQPVPVIEELPVIEEELEVVEEPTPQAAPVAILPKTGVANPFAFSGLGGILLGLGLFLKKKD